MYVRHPDSWHGTNTYDKASGKTAKPHRIYCEDTAINIKIISIHFYRSLISTHLRQSTKILPDFISTVKHSSDMTDCSLETNIKEKNFTLLKQEEILVTLESSFNKIHSEQRK